MFNYDVILVPKIMKFLEVGKLGAVTSNEREASIPDKLHDLPDHVFIR